MTRIEVMINGSVFTGDVEPRSLLSRIWVHSSPLARLASDHLPLLAEIALMATADRRAESPSASHV